jgi:hypothetical protein
MFRPAPFLVTVLDRVKAIVRRVARPAAVRVRAEPVGASAQAHVRAAPDGLVQHWMTAKLQALSALIRRIEAGETLEAPVISPRAATTGAASPLERVPGSPEERLPRGFGWMCAFGPNVRRDGAAFAAWLNEPAMQARVMAAPQRMARVIGPILNATGERRPAWLPEAPKRNVQRGEQIRLETGRSASPEHGAGPGIIWPLRRPQDAHAEPGGRRATPSDSRSGFATKHFDISAPPPSRRDFRESAAPCRQSVFRKIETWRVAPNCGHFVTIS